MEARLKVASGSSQPQKQITRQEINKFHNYVQGLLIEIYGDDSPLIGSLRSIYDSAVLLSAPMEGFKLLQTALGTVIEVLSTDVLAKRDNKAAWGAAGGVRRVFIGHGRNPVWSRVQRFIEEEVGIDTEAFESTSRASQHIIDILNDLLGVCDAAVIVMTADDETAEGRMRARQNVIHEAGLFQGRYGFGRVILLQQDGTEDFSNVAGLQTVPFNRNVEEGFYSLGRALRRLQEG